MYNQVSILRQHIYKAAEFGVDVRELCRRLNLTPEQLSNGEAHIPYTPGEEFDFWSHAVAMSGNPCLGLHMGQRVDRYNVFGMLGMLASSCKTVGEAMDKVARYNDTLTGVFRYQLHFSGNEGIFEMSPMALWEESNLESARQAVDNGIAGWLCALHELSVRKFYPLRTELKYSRRFEDEYRKVTQGPVLFNKPMNCFVFSKEDLNTPLNYYDPTLQTAFESLLIEKQKNLESRKTVSGQVRSLLISHFNGQITHVDLVASLLFMTTRTLQRKLSEENTSYRTICNELRKDLTLGLIKAGKTNKTQIAAMLGYSDESAFSKALRDWQKPQEK